MIKETDCARILRKENGIIYIRVKDESICLLQDARKIVEGLNYIANGEKHLVLFDPGKFSTINMEACKYLATEEAEISIAAKAGIVYSLAQLLLANFFIHFHKPPKPFKVFSSERKAITWLKNFDVTAS